MANQNFRVKNGLEVGVGGTILYAKDTGRIGIGRTDPGTDLDVAGNIRLSAGDPQIQLNDGGPRLRVPIANTLTIHTGGNLGTDDYERLRITSSGNIGIGTNNPGSGNILSVHGRTILGQVATGDATTKAEMISQASLRIKPHVTSSGALNFAQINNGDGIGLQFTNSTGTANWDIALQPYGGQVGIATDNPTQNLDINGATRFRGAIYDNNNSVGAANSVLSSTGSGVQWVSVSAGSDAGTLDGLDSTQFLRSDADDSASGVIDFLGGSSSTPAVRIKSGGNSWSEGLAIHPSSNNGYALTFYRTTASLTTNTNTWAIGNLGVNSTNNFGLLRNGLTGGSGIRVDSIFDVTQSGTFRFGFTPTVGSNTIWHAGNHGSGSGLDADTVDGIQGGSFLRSDADDTSSATYTFTNTSTTQKLNFSGNAGAANYNYFMSAGNDTGNKAVHFVNGSTRTSDGGVNTYTIRNDGGSLRLGKSSYSTLLEGSALTYNSNTVWHAGNDGSGSGLDADLLDGQQSSFYLNISSGSQTKGNSTDSRANALTLNYSSTATFSANSDIGDTNRTLTIQNPSTNTSNGLYAALHMQVGPNVAQRAMGDIKFVRDSGTRGKWYFSAKNTSGTFLDTLAFSTDEITYKGNTVWHAGNDGSGSGLDADTLDGINSGSFLRSDANDTLSAIITGHASNTEVLRVRSSSYSSNYIYIGGWSSANSTDISRIRSSSNLHIDGPSDGNLYLNWYASNRSIYLGNTGQSVYAAGNTVWHAGNDGSGSGLDADTLDGINSASFLRSDAADTSSAMLTCYTSLTNNDDYFNSPISIRERGAASAGDGEDRDSPNLNFHWAGRVSKSFWMGANGWMNWGEYNSSGVPQVDGTFRAGNLLISSSSHQVWHAGNDGSGSGLDADSVDGIDSSRIIYGSNANGTNNANPSTALKSGFYETYQTNAPTATWYSYINIRHTSTSSNYGHQIAGNFFNTSDIYNRNINNGSYGSWTKIWNASNDGSGSGLDADLLDGFQYTTFMRRDQTYSSDLNTVALAGVYRVNTFTNGPSGGASYGTLLNANNASDTGAQFYINYNDGNVFTRGGNSSTFNGSGSNTAWAKQWSSENDGSGSGLDADTLDGYGWDTYGKNLRGIEIYADNWFRNYNSGEGIYNQATTQHFYSDDDDGWNIAGGTSANWLRFRDEHAGTIRGYVYANNSSQVGFLNSAGSWSLRMDNSGNCNVTGTVTANSDIKLKTNITTITNALDKVRKLRGVEFDYIDTGKHMVGVIAQEVEEVIPEVVMTTKDKDSDDETKSVAYANMVAVLIEAIKEQQNKIDEYGQMIREQQNKIDELEQIIKDK